MLTEKDYCDYDTCVALEELGYDDSTDLRYNSYGSLGDFLGGIKAPTLYEAQKWLREAHNLHLEITYSPSCWTGKIYDLKEWDYIKGFTFFESFEDALHTLIKEAVKILKEKQDEKDICNTSRVSRQ